MEKLDRFVKEHPNDPKRKVNDNKHILNKCPVCGGELVYNEYCKHTEVFGITNDGEISKQRIRKVDCGTLRTGFLSCECCDFLTDVELNVEHPWELVGKIKIEYEKDQFVYSEKKINK